MTSENEKNKQEADRKIDEAIEKAVENAEARKKELSGEELDGIAGGTIAGGIRTIGLIAQE